MNKSLFVQEISKDLVMFDTKKLKEISNFINYLKYQDYLDPTLEILADEEWHNKVKAGIEEIEKGDVVDWNTTV